MSKFYKLSDLYKIDTVYVIPRIGLMEANTPIESTRKDKKLMVFATKNGYGKIIHFGQKGYSDFTKHKDKIRRSKYLKRSAGIRDHSGKLTKNDKFSANYWARRVLW